MKSFVFILSFLLFVSGITCISTNWRSDGEVLALYEEWLIKHQKLHSSFREKIKRFEIFKDNLRYIDEQNYNNKVKHKNFTLGLNQFADLTLDEFSSMYLGTSIDYEQIISSNPDHDYDQDHEFLSREGLVQLPKSVDWRQRGIVFPIRNQKKCGSCWAFSAVASIESLTAIVDGHMIALSEQELVDCDRGSDGCKAGYYDSAFAYAAKYGIASRGTYTYRYKKGECKQMRKVVIISGYKRVPSNNEKVLQSVVAQQVVSVGVKSKSKDFQFYKSGIFHGLCGQKLDHAVNIIGYGSKSGADYWIVRNSWGENWGEKGYMKIRRNTKESDGYCGIATHPSYPYGVKTYP